MNEQDKHLLRREIQYRSRRSLKEMDQLIGNFVAARLQTLDMALLVELRDMLEEMDQDLLASWRGEKEIPVEYARIFAALRAFKAD